MTDKPKFVDLAALSLSGSLVPSVPTQLLLKFNPPKLTITYHFEAKQNEEYYHDIEIDKKMLLAQSVQDFVSHLYVTEAYYFNPKQVKRSQLLRLVGILKDNVVSDDTDQQRSAQINIQDNSYQASNGSPNVNQSGSDNGSAKGRKKNYFERKRFINYQNNTSPTQDESDNDGQSQSYAPDSAEGKQESSPGMQQRRGATNHNALKNRRRFDELQIQNKNPSAGSTPEIPALNSLQNQRLQQNQLNDLPPLKGARGVPVSDPIFLNQGGKGGQNSGGGLRTQSEKSNLLENDSTSNNLSNFQNQNLQESEHKPLLRQQPGQSNLSGSGLGGSGLLNSVPVDNYQVNQFNLNDQQQTVQGSGEDPEFQNENMYDQVNDSGIEQQQLVDENGEPINEQLGDELVDEEEEGESVYMIDGVIMQKIQIEGEANQYLMDAQGRIFDMQANFVGTYPNSQGLDEMQQQDGQVQEQQEELIDI